ncbi:hypothetical protein SETIT_5G148900v2 [Setaria italica]|uniref:RING-type domain-containing protein n=1 Tax=Setaria italica TaxID=4555 RepID=K3XST7_SETIT|nr:RING-H2 finger protein ATL66 [Setaria italica]RCV25223.1 hypothetical protein SETIT_5G148900v2 [Setaria italica]
MPATTGANVVCEYDGVGVALELAALAAFVVLLRYAAVLYANHLLTTLCVDDDDNLPAAARRDDGRGGVSGLDAAALARLPSFVSHGTTAAAAEQCAVCLGAVEEGETVRALPCCTHAFHARCVDAWLRLRPICPVCRATCR